VDGSHEYQLRLEGKTMSKKSPIQLIQYPKQRDGIDYISDKYVARLVKEADDRYCAKLKNKKKVKKS